MTTTAMNENKFENLKEIKELIRQTFNEMLEIDLDPTVKSELYKKINQNYNFDNLILTNLNKFFEARLNKKLTEETEKYEECLKKLESDIRKHIRVIIIT